MLDRARDFAAEEMFLIGVRLLSGALDPERAGRAYSALAQSLVAALLERVGEAFARDHGRVRGGRVAVIAMGKLGSREMTAASDLDLIVIYDFPADAGESDGARPLGAVVYYTRLTQRLLAALTAPTKAGKLYDVDLRLRPSGRKGPLATQFSAFTLYQKSEAETWEHMALTRARVVAGEPSARRGDRGRDRRRPHRAARAGEARARGARDAQADRQREGRPGPLGPQARLRAASSTSNSSRNTWRSPTRAIIPACSISRPARSSPRPARAACLAPTMPRRSPTPTGSTPTPPRSCASRSPARSIPHKAASGVKRRIAAAAALPDFESLQGAVSEARDKVRHVYARVLGGQAG